MMAPVVWIGVMVTVLVFSVSYNLKKRKKAGITGVKSALSSISFYLIAITNLLAYGFGFLGIFSWVLTIAFLLVGAYFTKYLPVPA